MVFEVSSLYNVTFRSLPLSSVFDLSAESQPCSAKIKV